METENKCKVIITGLFNEGGMEMPEFKEYSEKAGAIMEAGGGVMISKNAVEENLGNGNAPHIVIVMEFPSKENVIDIFSSDEYKSIIPIRDVAVREVNILITK